MTKYGYLPGESYEDFRARYARQDETGKALAEARADRGAWLTEDEKMALVHNSRWGSDSYPVVKLGHKWNLAHPLAKSDPLYKTKREAVAAWEIKLAMWRALSGIEAYNRTMAERGES